jgi:hypothetical protein
MAINFPDSPTLNEIALVGSSYYIWNGTSWVGYSTSFTVNYNASSIVVEGNGSPLGATTTINFSTNLTTTYDASGIATVTGSAGGGGGESYWVSTDVGIHTLSNVGVGTTNPTSKLSVTGDGYFTGVITASSFSGSGSNLTGIVTGITAGANITVLENPSGNFIITSTASGGGSSQWVSTDVGIHTLSNVGIATTNPITQLQVDRFGTQAGFGTFSATAGVSTTIDTFATSFLTAEYTVHIGYGTYIQAQKVLIMNNGATAYSQEYGIMYEPSQIVSIGATVSGSNVLLEVTPETGITGLTTYRFVRNTLI